MAQVTIEQKEQELDFPKYMISHNGNILIYALTDNDDDGKSLTGVCISDNLGHNLKGELIHNWSKSIFKDFRGTFKVEQ